MPSRRGISLSCYCVDGYEPPKHAWAGWTPVGQNHTAGRKRQRSVVSSGGGPFVRLRRRVAGPAPVCHGRRPAEETARPSNSRSAQAPDLGLLTLARTGLAASAGGGRRIGAGIPAGSECVGDHLWEAGLPNRRDRRTGRRLASVYWRGGGRDGHLIRLRGPSLGSSVRIHRAGPHHRGLRLARRSRSGDRLGFQDELRWP